MDCGYYVLIKHNEKYNVFIQSNINLIIKTLLKIIDNNPGLIDCQQFESYIRAISDDEIGINSGRLDLVKKYGKVEYIFN